jgi:hypothetical protein
LEHCHPSSMSWSASENLQFWFNSRGGEKVLY